MPFQGEASLPLAVASIHLDALLLGGEAEGMSFCVCLAQWRFKNTVKPLVVPGRNDYLAAGLRGTLIHHGSSIASSLDLPASLSLTVPKEE